jgi:glucuronate isomerase
MWSSLGDIGSDGVEKRTIKTNVQKVFNCVYTNGNLGKIFVYLICNLLKVNKLVTWINCERY